VIKNLKLALLIAFVSIFSCGKSMAAYQDPTGKTNVNQQTDLFKKSIDDLNGFQRQLELDKDTAAKDLGGASQGSMSISDKTSAEIEANANDLNNIRSNDLAGEGRKKLMQEKVLETMYPDETSPLYAQHKKDAEAIAAGSGKLMGNLLAMLKDLGVDCKTVKGNKIIEPEYFPEIKTEVKRKKKGGNTIYNKRICEELRNQYYCRDKLTLRCLDFSEKPVKFIITGSTIPYLVTPRDDYTSFNFSSTGHGGSQHYSGGGTLKKGLGNKALAAIGFGLVKSSSSTINASELSFSFSFNIGCPLATLSRLELVDISYGTFLSIKINGNIIYVGPTAGDNLALAGHHTVVTKGKKKCGGKFGKRAAITTLYPKVSAGSGGEHVLGNDGGIAGSFAMAKIDLTPYVLEGDNNIEIKVIGIDPPFASFALNASERVCRNWQEIWEETCSIK
jgi:hypothetical protein